MTQQSAHTPATQTEAARSLRDDSLCGRQSFVTVVWVLLILDLIYKLWRAYRLYTLPGMINGNYFTEFLINYSAGFVRRGLTGEWLHSFCQSTGIAAQTVIVIFSVLAWAAVWIFFLRGFRSKRLSPWLIFSPLFLGYTLDIIRKDYLCYLLIILLLYVVRARPRVLTRLAAMLIICFGLLIYEPFILFGVPVAALLMLGQRKCRVWSVVTLTVAAVVFLLTCRYSGSRDMALTIFASWRGLLGDETLMLSEWNSIGALGWETLPTFKLHLRCNFYSEDFGAATGLVRLFGMVCYYYLMTNFLPVFSCKPDEQTAMRNRIGLLYILSLLCLLPMFLVLSCDYCRLYQYIAVVTYATIIIIPSQRIDNLLPGKIGARAANLVVRLNNFLTATVVPTKGTLLIMLFICAATPYQYSLIEAAQQSIGGSLCELLSKIIISIVK